MYRHRSDALLNPRDDRDPRGPADPRDARDERLAKDPRDERDERRAGRQQNVSVASLVLLIVVLAGLNLWWNARTEAQTKAATITAAKAAIQRDDQQWCSLLGAVLAGPFPRTPSAAAFRQRLSARYVSLGCVNGNHPHR